VVPLVELAAELADVDFAIVPLELGNPYCEAKSEVRYMEAGAVAVPLIASPIEAYRAAIRNGQTGMLAATTEQWIAALRVLIDEPERRRAFGMAAHADVLRRYTPVARSRELLDVLATVWETTEPAHTTSFNDVFIKSLVLYQELATTHEQTMQELSRETLRRAQNEHELAIAHQAEDHLHQQLGLSHQAADWLQQQLATMEARVVTAEQEAHMLRDQVDQIARGRVLRTLNALSRWRARR
jgi:hypothetical protein